MHSALLLDILFPRICLICSEKTEDGVTCPRCTAAISLNRNLFCSRCGVPYAPPVPFCGCKTIYRLGAAGSYDDPVIRALIHALKFDCMRDAGVPLAKLLLYYVKTISADLCGYTVVPIPLSRKRERVRGFNQAELVGSMFARESSLPLDTDIIFRREHRKPQSETRNIKERRENIRGCYSLCPRSRPVPKSIVLIDDVTTSGATFREAITVLASAGIENIFALAVAKA